MTTNPAPQEARHVDGAGGGEKASADIRERDLITLEMVVEKVFPDYLQLLLKPLDVACEKGGGVRVAINYAAIIRHRPPALQAGARVKFVGNPDSISGRIRHIIGSQAWVEWPGYEEVVSLAFLERENRAALASARGEQP